MVRIAALFVVIGATLAAVPAQAQFGNVYGDAPPRPPADVPNGPFPAQPPPVQYPGQQPYSSQQQYPSPPPPQQYPAQQQSRPVPAPVARGPSGIQAQPLPPPPGATLAPANANRTNAPAPAAPPQGSATAPTPANPGAPQQADTAPPTALPGQEDDTTVIETPTEKIENGRAVFAGLDKITGRTIKFDAAIGETVQFGALQVTARACNTRPPTEPTNTDAFVEVDEVTLQGEIKRIFTGWMFASSPGLNAVEHPIYDVWLTGCENPLSGSVAESASPPAPPAAAAPRQGVPPRQASPPRRPAAPSPAAEPPATDD
jgi:hypothetical protein